jgi:signal transduction histidine kinase
MVILLVGDGPVVLETIGGFLAQRGHEVATAADGLAATATLSRCRDVGLVLAEVRMPKMDGLALLRHVRLQYPAVPVALITQFDDMDVAATAVREGAHDLLRIPVEPGDLLLLVERVERRRELEASIVAEHARLAHADRLVAIDALSAGIAHAIGRPSAMARANLRTLGRCRERMSPVLHRPIATGGEPEVLAIGDDLPSLTARMLSGAERVRDLVQGCAECAGAGGTGPRNSIDLETCIENAVALTAAETQGIRVKRQGTTAVVRGSAADLSAVFSHLLRNAAHALRGVIEPCITIEVQAVVARAARVSVYDNGPGVPALLRERIFDPLFTTGEPGQSLGLGLPICRGILAAHGGNLACEPAPAGGACFVVELPIAADPRWAKACPSKMWQPPSPSIAPPSTG